jgi:hypothetical protein
MTSDWFWEGNVQAAIADYLGASGWTVIGLADTASKARGFDIAAQQGNRHLVVEVKGFPSKDYADPRRAGETKRTIPLNQAPKWYAQAILKAMRTRGSLPSAEIAIGLPDYPRYRTLIQETEGSLRHLGFGVYLVDDQGEVTCVVPHRQERTGDRA